MIHSRLFKRVLLALCVAAAFSAVACAKTKTPETPSFVTGYALAGERDGKVTVASNVETFDFAANVTVNDGLTVSVSYDASGLQKTETPAVLQAGDNVYYITVTDGQNTESHKVNVYRLRALRVVFDLDGGTGDFPEREVEEGTLLSAPTAVPQKAGCDFAGWNYDFTAPVTASVKIKAAWSPRLTDYTVQVFTTDDTETWTERTDKTLTTEGYAYSPVQLTADEVPEIEGYAFVESDSLLSGVIAPDGSLTLELRYCKLVNVNCTVNVPAGDSRMTVSLTDSAGTVWLKSSEIAGGQIQLSGQVPVRKDSVTLKATGYAEQEQFSLLGRDDITYTLTPKTYEFGGFTLDGLIYPSAGHEVRSDIAAVPSAEADSNDWYSGEMVYAVPDSQTTYNYGQYLLARGVPNAIYFNQFAATEYAVGADVYTAFSNFVTGTHGSSYSSRTGGISIATPHDQLHIVITDNATVWIGFGRLSADGLTNGDVYIKGSPANLFTPFNLESSGTPVNALSGYQVTVIRKNGQLSVYISGTKCLTLDATDGVTGYGPFASSGLVYTSAGTVQSPDALKTRLAHFLAADTPNAVGFTGLCKTVDANRGKNYAGFNNMFRSTDVAAAEQTLAQLAADSTRFVKQLTVNGKSTITQLSNGRTIRYGYNEDEIARAVNWYQSAASVTAGWIYDAANNELTGVAKSANTNHPIFINDVQTGSFELRFTAAFDNPFAGVVISDGTGADRLFIGRFNATSTALRICNSDNQGAASAAGLGTDAETDFRLVVDKTNQKIELYIKNATYPTETKAVTMTANGVTQHVKSTVADFTETTNTTATVKGAVANLLNASELAAGFGYTTSCTGTVKYGNIALTAID